MVDKKRNEEQHHVTISQGDIQNLIASMDYARWDHPTVMKAFTMMRQLNTWLRSRYAEECSPHAHISVAAFGLVLMINDIPIWDSENNGIEELSIDFCKEQLREHALTLMAAFE